MAAFGPLMARRSGAILVWITASLCFMDQGNFVLHVPSEAGNSFTFNLLTLTFFLLLPRVRFTHMNYIKATLFKGHTAVSMSVVFSDVKISLYTIRSVAHRVWILFVFNQCMDHFAWKPKWSLIAYLWHANLYTALLLYEC
jgi:hypothetical protein